MLDAPDIGSHYYYGACVDTVAGESDTTNNCSAAVKVETTHKKPQLEITPVRIESSQNRVRISATVRNIGGPAATTTLRFYRSTDDVISSSDTQVRAFSVPALVKTESHEFPKFDSKWVDVTEPSGSYWYGACVDAVANESDTTDNCRSIHKITR